MEEEKQVALLIHLPTGKQWKSRPFTAKGIEEVINEETNTFKAIDCDVFIADEIMKQCVVEAYKESYFELGEQKNVDIKE